jgi:flagellum-specific ATP synthase
LVGERGREVSEFIHENLGPEGLARSVVVVATSDQPAPARILAAEYATRIAQWFRDRGEDVLLIMDSVTRYAMALREVGLAAGELPVARGYPPSVFSALPRLLERAGASERGTMTAVYTVLVEGDDMQEPIADAVRGTLDGHVVLSRALAELGHYPAIDPTMSISRLAHRVATPAAQTVSRRFITLWSAYQQHQDLIRLGAYVPGTDPLLDEAVRYHVRMAQALQQRPDEPPVLDAVARLDRAMAEEGEESLHAAV